MNQLDPLVKVGDIFVQASAIVTIRSHSYNGSYVELRTGEKIHVRDHPDAVADKINASVAKYAPASAVLAKAPGAAA